MSYPEGVVPTLEKVHPTPVYEAILFAGLFVMLWLLRKKAGPGDGWFFAMYLILAGVLRFFLEYVRTTPVVFVGLTFTQILSILLILGGILWIALIVRSKKAATVS